MNRMSPLTIEAWKPQLGPGINNGVWHIRTREQDLDILLFAALSSNMFIITNSYNVPLMQEANEKNTEIF